MKTCRSPASFEPPMVADLEDRHALKAIQYRLLDRKL